jgi:hypothetical protein
VTSTIFLEIGSLAERTNWQRLGDNFRRGPGDFNYSNLLAVIAIVAAFAIGLLLLRHFTGQRDGGKSHHSPPELFRELCRKHRLDRVERRLLKRLAAAWELTSPSLLFVEPDYFEVDDLPDVWQDKTHLVARLRARLFGESY